MTSLRVPYRAHWSRDSWPRDRKGRNFRWLGHYPHSTKDRLTLLESYSALLAVCEGYYFWQMDTPDKGPVTRTLDLLLFLFLSTRGSSWTNSRCRYIILATFFEWLWLPYPTPGICCFNTIDDKFMETGMNQTCDEYMHGWNLSSLGTKVVFRQFSHKRFHDPTVKNKKDSFKKMHF